MKISKSLFRPLQARSIPHRHARPTSILSSSSASLASCTRPTQSVSPTRACHTAPSMRSTSTMSGGLGMSRPHALHRRYLHVGRRVSLTGTARMGASRLRVGGVEGACVQSRPFSTTRAVQARNSKLVRKPDKRISRCFCSLLSGKPSWIV